MRIAALRPIPVMRIATTSTYPRACSVLMNNESPRFSPRPRLFFVLLMLSFVPYFLPYDMQPEIYHDGMDAQQFRKKQQKKTLDTIMGGDSSKTGLFPDIMPNIIPDIINDDFKTITSDTSSAFDAENSKSD